MRRSAPGTSAKIPIAPVKQSPAAVTHRAEKAVRPKLTMQRMAPCCAIPYKKPLGRWAK